MFDAPFRLATIGESAVGKTSIIRIISEDRFDSGETATVGVDFGQITKKVDGEKISIEIWDTAGQERFRSLVPVYCRNVNAALAVFDVTSKESFDQLESWIHLFQSLGNEKRLVFAVGNKMDLPEEAREIDIEKIKEWAAKRNIPIFFCSAKTGDGIDDLVSSVVDALIEAFPRRKPNNTVDLDVDNGKDTEKSCC